MNGAQISLSQLTAQIQQSISDSLPSTVWIVAEVSELNINRNGHCYLELVEFEHDSKKLLARTRATIWSYSFRMIKPYFESVTGQAFTQGIKILVEVAVDYHQVYGLNLNIKDIDPSYTMGDMARKRKEIINQLKSDGIFEMNKEHHMPLVPQRIAIISSPTAAGLQDFMNQLHDNKEGIAFASQLFPATMQGEHTAPSIIDALDTIADYAEHFDLVVIIRGGGAQLDLASFDDYELANNVAQFPLPIVTGIGHDKDESIVDLVAHTSVKTPTAVAEFILDKALDFKQFIDSSEALLIQLTEQKLSSEQFFLKESSQQLKLTVRNMVEREKNNFSVHSLRIKSATFNYMEHKAKSFDHKNNTLRFLVNGKLQTEEFKLAARLKNLRSSTKLLMNLQEKELNHLETQCKLYDPSHILQRGYSIMYKDGQLIKSASDVKAGDEVETQLHNGSIKSIIKK